MRHVSDSHPPNQLAGPAAAQLAETLLGREHPVFDPLQQRREADVRRPLPASSEPDSNA